MRPTEQDLFRRVFLELVRGLVVRLYDGATVIFALEALKQFVAAILIDRHFVGDLHPVGPLELVRVKDLRVDLGRIVDNDEYLSLGVEVRTGTVQELVLRDGSGVGHRVRAPSRWRVGLSRGRPPPGAGTFRTPATASWRIRVPGRRPGFPSRRR